MIRNQLKIGLMTLAAVYGCGKAQLSSLVYIPEPGEIHYRYVDLGIGQEILPRGLIPLETVTTTGCYRVFFDEQERPVQVDYLTNGLQNPYVYVFGYSNRILIEYDGVDTYIRYVDLEDNPTSSEGAFGYNLCHDQSGRTILLTMLDEDKNPTQTDNGLASIVWEWTENSCVHVSSYRGDGSLIPIELEPVCMNPRYRFLYGFRIPESYESMTAEAFCYEVDRNGRLLSQWAVDSVGNIVSTSDGIARSEACYDDQGNRIWIKRYDADGVLMLNEYEVTTLQLSGDTTEVDEHGYLLNANRIAFTQYVYDDECDAIEWRNIGVDGSPVEDIYGIAYTLLQKSSDGRFREYTSYDLDGVPVNSLRWEYDESGRLVDQIRDLDPGSDSGYSHTHYTFESPGRTYVATSLDEDGNQVMINYISVYGIRYVCDDYDRNLEYQYLDIDGNLCENALGAAIDRVVFNENGEPVTSEALDLDGQPVRPMFGE